MRTPGPIEPRFWSKVEKTDGCWLWSANRNNKGYGLFALPGGRTVTAHRFSWQLAHGAVPLGMQVCHHCDVRNCVRPDHLFLGTNADNMRDAEQKGRLSMRELGRATQFGPGNTAGMQTRFGRK